MRVRRIAVLVLIVVSVSCLITFKLRANSALDGVTTTLPNGLTVTAINPTQPDWSAILFGGSICRFHIHNPMPRRMLNVYVETIDKNLKATTAAGIGIAPSVDQPGKQEVDCLVALVPMGNSLFDSERIKVTILMEGTSSISPIIQNPFYRRDQTGTFGGGVYNPNGSWTIMACGVNGVTTGPQLNDLTMVVRFDTSPPISTKQTSAINHPRQ